MEHRWLETPNDWIGSWLRWAFSFFEDEDEDEEDAEFRG
jgi:hypothetical protein